MYQIQSKSDFQAGATLIVRIPEEELDQKALYTILADKPDFILPFRHRIVDGQIEFTYQVGNRSKLSYMSENRSPIEYAKLWSDILCPLMDCNDWFMTPYSFVLNSDYLYTDKNTGTISFLYIPSVKEYSNYETLKTMVTDIAKQNHVTDINLENKVVWAIQDFNPTEFLKMVKSYGMQDTKEPTPKYTSEFVQSTEQSRISTPVQAQVPVKPIDEPRIIEQKQPVASSKAPDEISIKFSSDKKTTKADKKKTEVNNTKKTKEEKIKPPTKEKKSFWSAKKPQQEIRQGAAIITNESNKSSIQPSTPIYNEPMDYDDGVTQLDINESEGTRFRYIGKDDHPKAIIVDISIGSVFIIGRFDASIGTKKSDFEFDKKTKAVSRRHVAIERNSDGYNIVDLSSAAGTFFNGQKLPPNAPFKLEQGCRVSFGYSGADYIWEE